MHKNFLERQLAIHKDNLTIALELKDSGETLIWEYDDYCLPIDEYINRKKERVITIQETLNTVGEN
jgi:hypothetical protein